MSSTLSNPRRAPQQERGERRLAQLLAAAATVLAESGYDAATMTEIADRAGASIGTLYQYFPNKEAVVLALRTQYREEMEERWRNIDVDTAGMSIEQIAHRLVDIMVGFVEERPAYFQIVDATVKFKRSQEARNRLRQRIAKVFRNQRRDISQDLAIRMANVSLEIIKGLIKLYADANAKDREELVREFKTAVAAYLEMRLGRAT